jgi:type I restriction enzyme S subunit
MNLRNSELGEIPKGWRVKPIGDVVRCVGGSTPSTKNPNYWEGGVNPFVTPKDMSALSSPMILDTERHITDMGVKQISSGQLPVGTVILSSRAPIGYLAIAEIPVSVNQGVIAMICDGDLPNNYVLYWVEANMETIKGSSGGTTFPEISKKNFRPIPVIIPSKKVLGAFVELVEPMHRRIVNNLRESATHAAIRDALLPKLLSGEIRVKDAKRFLKEGGL